MKINYKMHSGPVTADAHSRIFYAHDAHVVETYCAELFIIWLDSNQIFISLIGETYKTNKANYVNFLAESRL